MTSPEGQRYLLTHSSTATQGAPAVWVFPTAGLPDTMIVIQTAEIGLNRALLTPLDDHGYLVHDVTTQLLKVVAPISLPRVTYAQASLIANVLDSGQVLVQMSKSDSRM